MTFADLRTSILKASNLNHAAICAKIPDLQNATELNTLIVGMDSDLLSVIAPDGRPRKLPTFKYKTSVNFEYSNLIVTSCIPMLDELVGYTRRQSIPNQLSHQCLRDAIAGQNQTWDKLEGRNLFCHFDTISDFAKTSNETFNRLKSEFGLDLAIAQSKLKQLKGQLTEIRSNHSQSQEKKDDSKDMIP